MPPQTQTITLLVMTSQASEAEQLIKSLRDGGLPVRGIYTDQVSRMEALLVARACEVILCCGYDPGIDVDAVLARYRELAADIPLIMIAEPASPPLALSRPMHGGARDVTMRGDGERLRLIMARLRDPQAGCQNHRGGDQPACKSPEDFPVGQRQCAVECRG